MFDFDTVIDRKHTMSLKYDFADAKGRPRDAIPFWIADMDFKTAPCVTDALRRRLDHGIMGYSDMTDDYFRAVHQWFLTHFGWDVKKNGSSRRRASYRPSIWPCGPSRSRMTPS